MFIRVYKSAPGYNKSTIMHYVILKITLIFIYEWEAH